VLRYPKVPIPHPGQSYNPSKEDLTNLMVKIVDLNKKPDATVGLFEKKEEIINEEEKIFISDDEFENEVEKEIFDENDNINHLVSNNPPIDDSTRKTRKEKKQIEKLKHLKLIERDAKVRKENRIKLNSAQSIKKIERERQKKSKHPRSLREKKI